MPLPSLARGRPSRDGRSLRATRATDGRHDVRRLPPRRPGDAAELAEAGKPVLARLAEALRRR